MVHDVRSLSYRKVLAVALAALLTAGYLVVAGGGGSSSVQAAKDAPPAKELTPSDLLLAAAAAKGITMSYSGITTAGGGDIIISSFQVGTSRPISGPAAGHVQSGPPQVSEVTVTKQLDRYSTKLLLASLGGASASVVLTFTDLSGPGATLFDYMRVELPDVLISGFSTSSGGDQPTESLSLNFTKMKFVTHIPAGTTQTMNWDFAGPA